jgi:predicted glycosyltransferase
MGEGLIQKIIENFAKKFTKVWLPDQPTAPLAGRLVQHSKLKNTAFVGALSRFCGNLDAEYPKDIDILVLLSGLEPQRTLLENIIITQVNDDFFSTQKVVLVRGLPLLNATPAPHKNLWQIHNYLPQVPLESLIKRSKLVVCRSGYSTIMDLATAQSKAAFVPTPGQTEQVYLSAHLQKSGVAPYHHQHNFDFKKLIYQSEKYSGFADKYTENCDYLLKTQVTSLLASIY